MMKKKGKSTNRNNWLIVIALITIIALVVYYFMNNKINNYSRMENDLVKAAENYVKNNNISSAKEVYFDVTKLGISLENGCNVTSGVFYQNNKYQAYLSCQDYETKILDTSNDFLSLNGKSIYVIAKGIGFYDPGYTSSDIVNVIGEISDEEGVYNLFYAAKNSNAILTRKVVVVDNPIIKSLFPTISLFGEKETYVIQENQFIDDGVMASDTNGEEITEDVKVIGKVDSSIIGDYKIVYVITNAQGYTNSTSRIVSVVSPVPDLDFSYKLDPNKLTSKDVSINVSVFGDDFSHVVLPDLTIEEKDRLSYVVSENGTYEFVVYDNKGRSLKESVVVDNIDRTKPVASCTATWRYNKTEVVVNISSTRVISSYEYNIDNNIQVSSINTFTSPLIKPNNISVKIVDEIDNSETINCNISDQSTPQIYVDANGKRCLEGYTCYVQKDWKDSSYYFCADIAKKSCGTIAGHGCSITSFATAVSKFGVTSSNGQLHNPYTLLTEIYNGTNISRNGYCSSGCSGWSAIKRAGLALGLSVQDKYLPFNKNNVDTFKDYLRKGYSVIIAVGAGPYSTGNHIIAVLGIRDDDYVYLYNTNAGASNSSFQRGFKQNDWVPIDDLLHGNVDSFLAIGPKA